MCGFEAGLLLMRSSATSRDQRFPIRARHSATDALTGCIRLSSIVAATANSLDPAVSWAFFHGARSYWKIQAYTNDLDVRGQEMRGRAGFR